MRYDDMKPNMQRILSRHRPKCPLIAPSLAVAIVQCSGWCEPSCVHTIETQIRGGADVVQFATKAIYSPTSKCIDCGCRGYLSVTHTINICCLRQI